jgi:hypothetical protein
MGTSVEVRGECLFVRQWHKYLLESSGIEGRVAFDLLHIIMAQSVFRT